MGTRPPDLRMLRPAALLALALLVTGCGSQSKVPSGSSISSAQTASSPAPAPATGTPVAVPSPRPATQAELAAMLAAGKGPAERDQQLGDGPNCPGDQPCLLTNEASGTMGVHAGFFQAASNCPSGSNACSGAVCFAYLYEQSGSWHYVNAKCIQAGGLVPGPDSYVYVSGGCANVRATPGTSGKVVACLPDQTRVSVEGGPFYADGKIWWHLKDRGWMAHDFLVQPPTSPSPS